MSWLKRTAKKIGLTHKKDGSKRTVTGAILRGLGAGAVGAGVVLSGGALAPAVTPLLSGVTLTGALSTAGAVASALSSKGRNSQPKQITGMLQSNKLNGTSGLGLPSVTDSKNTSVFESIGGIVDKVGDILGGGGSAPSAGSGAPVGGSGGLNISPDEISALAPYVIGGLVIWKIIS